VTIGELLVKLGVDAKELGTGFKGAVHEAESFSSGVKHHAGVAGKAISGLEAPIHGVGKVLGSLSGVASTAMGFLAAQGVDSMVQTAQHAAQLVKQEDAIRTQTAAVLASTKGAANMTADSVDALAASLGKQDAVAKDAVESNENLLLTFTNVKNQVGAGNDIFNQATQATLNMSRALGEDGASASIQLGKALNDPIKGLTALQRVGVMFTEQQKEQIKTLVAHGQTLAAQKMILGELNTEFGGSAKAYGDSAAGSMDKIGQSVDEAEKSLARGLLPAFESAIQLLPPLIDDATQFAATIEGMVGSFAKLPGVSAILGNIGNLFGALTGKGDLKSAGTNLASSLAAGIKSAFPVVTQALLDGAQTLFDWLVNEGVPMMATNAGKMFDTLSQVLPPAFLKVLQWIGKNAPVLLGKLGEWGKAFVGWVGQRLPSLLAALGDLLGKVGAWIINTGLPTLARQLLEWGQQLVAWIGPQIPVAIKDLGDMLDKLVGWLTGPAIPQLAGGMGDLGRAGIAAIMDFFVGSHGQPGLLQKLTSWFVNTFIPALPGIVGSIYSGLVNFATDIGKAIIKGVGDTLAGLGQAVLDALTAALRWALSIGIQVGPVKLGLGYATISTPVGNFTLPGLATGVRNFVGGMALVGEAGPELAYLPRGSNVLPAGDTKALMGNRGSTTVIINNPKPERSSDSIRHQMRRLAVLGYVAPMGS